MIELHRFAAASGTPRIKLFGLGGAGTRAVESITAQLPGVEPIAINTDAQALAASRLERKIQLGQATTRGMGAGSDPELGYNAINESFTALREEMDGAQIVFICVGLGGGTGCGAAPTLAALAREAGALAIVFATMPFEFEGRRRRDQADAALAQLREQADLVVCFENDRMKELTGALTGVQEAFAAADTFLSQSIAAVAALASRRGPLYLGLDELASLLRSQDATCIFGHGRAAGDQRGRDAFEAALASPLMDRGHLLNEAHSILVAVSGGPSTSLIEVENLMSLFHENVSPGARIFFGLAVDDSLGDALTVSILASLGSARFASAAPAPAVAARAPRVAAAAPAPQPTINYVDTDEAVHRPPVEPLHPPLSSVAPTVQPTPEPVAESDTPPTAEVKPKKQQEMQFDVSKGRFEKTEPTIVDGQDRDIPAFLRKGLRFK